MTGSSNSFFANIFIMRKLRRLFFLPTLGWIEFTAAELAQLVERLTAEREVAGSIPAAGWILKVLK